jgi:hypothetical protein
LGIGFIAFIPVCVVRSFVEPVLEGRKEISMMRCLGLVFVLLLSTAARASSVDFNNYTPLDTTVPVVSYQGLTFTSNSLFMGVWGNSPNDNGTPALIAGYGSSSNGVTITQTGGGAFDLDNFDMSISWYDGSSSLLVNVVATLFGGGTESEQITLGQGIKQYDLNLDNVTSVSVSGDPNGYWLMDNVNANAGVTPEPGSLLLLGTGIAGLAAAIRRKMRA